MSRSFAGTDRCTSSSNPASIVDALPMWNTNAAGAIVIRYPSALLRWLQSISSQYPRPNAGSMSPTARTVGTESRTQNPTAEGMSTESSPNSSARVADTQSTASGSVRNRWGSAFGSENMDALFDHAVTDPMRSSRAATFTRADPRFRGSTVSEFNSTT